MGRAPLEVADIVRVHREAFLQRYGHAVGEDARRALHAILACRTAELGGHKETRRCNHCGHIEIAYNSCRHRACPKCGALAKEEWLAKRRAELLPVEYFHLVFTIPDELGPLALANRRAVYEILFAASAEALLKLAADPQRLGARLGGLAIIHTWGQTLRHHPHIHMIVPGGGLSPDGKRWVGCRKRFLLPVKPLSRLFRRLFLEKLETLHAKGGLVFQGIAAARAEDRLFRKLLAACRTKDWFVYAKPPFGGSEKGLRYLARYTRRTAISNSRLLKLADGKVSFRYKDYAHGGEMRVMTLDAVEFLRRFLLHVPPKGFVRVRYFGLFANRFRTRNLARCRELLGAREPEPLPDLAAMPWPDRMLLLTGHDPILCRVCKKGRMLMVESPISKPSARDPPDTGLFTGQAGAAR